MENSKVVPKKCKTRITVWSANFMFGYVPQRIENRLEEVFVQLSL